jgi:hypothetical protein
VAVAVELVLQLRPQVVVREVQIEFQAQPEQLIKDTLVAVASILPIALTLLVVVVEALKLLAQLELARLPVMVAKVLLLQLQVLRLLALVAVVVRVFWELTEPEVLVVVQTDQMEQE